MNRLLTPGNQRRRWSSGSNGTLGNTADDCANGKAYTVENFEREFDFEGCTNITFYEGQERSEKFLMSTKGSGHMTLPAGVLVVVDGGKARCGSAGSIVGGGGIRAPPPSRVSGYAPSSADSGYSGSYAGGNSHRLSPPRDAASFSRPSSNVNGGNFDDNCSIAPSESVSSVGTRGIRR